MHYQDEVFWISGGTSPHYWERGAVISARRPAFQNKWEDPWELTKVCDYGVAVPGSRVQAVDTRLAGHLDVFYVKQSLDGVPRVGRFTSYEIGGNQMTREWRPDDNYMVPPKDAWAFRVSFDPEFIGPHCYQYFPKIIWTDKLGQVQITVPNYDRNPFVYVTNAGEASGSGGIAGEARWDGNSYNIAWIRPDDSVRGRAGMSQRLTNVYDIAPAGETGAAPGARIASLAAPDKWQLDRVVYAWVRPDGGVQLAESVYDMNTTDPNIPHKTTLTQAAIQGSSTASSGLGLVADWPCPGSRMVLYRGPDGSLRSSYSIPESRTWSGDVESSEDGKSLIHYSISVNTNGSLSWSGTVTKNNPDRPFFTITISLWPFSDTGLGPLIFIANGKADGAGPSWNTTTQPKQVVVLHRDEYTCSSFQQLFETSATDPGPFRFASHVRDNLLTAALSHRTAAGDRALTKSCVTPIVGAEARRVCTPGFYALEGVLVRGEYVALAGPDNCVFTIPPDPAISSQVATRALTPAEYAWAQNEVFGPASLPPADRIRVTNLDIPFRDFTSLGHDGTVLLHLGKADYPDPIKTRPGRLIHHLVHAWQVAHHQPSGTEVSSLADALLLDAMPHSYKLDIFPAVETTKPQKKWRSFTVEQQARVVEYWFEGKRQKHFQAGKPVSYFDNGTGVAKDVKSPYYLYVVENIHKGVA